MLDGRALTGKYWFPYGGIDTGALPRQEGRTFYRPVGRHDTPEAEVYTEWP